MKRIVDEGEWIPAPIGCYVIPAAVMFVCGLVAGFAVRWWML